MGAAMTGLAAATTPGVGVVAAAAALAAVVNTVLGAVLVVAAVVVLAALVVLLAVVDLVVLFLRRAMCLKSSFLLLASPYRIEPLLANIWYDPAPQKGKNGNNTPCKRERAPIKAPFAN